MKRQRIVIMIVALAFLSGCGGGGSDGSTGDPSKLYVSKLTSGGIEIGTVFADDANNSIVSVPETGSDVIKRLMGAFNDGSFMTVEMQNGVPVSATDGTTTVLFSNWTANTVDITLISDGETETVEDVDFSEYMPATTAAKGWAEFAGATWTTISVGYCPISIALAGASMGLGVPGAVVGCSLAATNLYRLLTGQPTLVEQAVTYVTAPADCVDVAEGTASLSQMQSCVNAAGQSASSNSTYVSASGEIGTDDGDDDGDGDSDRVAGYCMTGDTCTDYALLADQVEQASEACSMAGGTFGTGACPTSTALGYCTVNAGTSGEYELVYYPPTYTLTIAQQHCSALGGQWTSN